MPREPRRDNSNFIYRTLKGEILNLAIAPGTVISENEVCECFSVSRTPVRSAFLRLSGAKLIKIVPYKETRVTRVPSSTSIRSGG
jgi:DNA-binding GntR family transcriptional regulator